MKPTYLLGLSVAAAAILFSGCGSSDDAVANPAAITAPDEVKQAIDLNQSTIQNIMAYIRYSAGSAAIPAPQKAPQPDSNVTGTYTYDCGLAGTSTSTYVNTYLNEDDGSWTSKYDYTDTYDNCTYSTTYSPGSFTANRRTLNGTQHYYYGTHYDNATGVTHYFNGGNDNYTNVYDNNETDLGLTSYTYANTLTGNHIYYPDGSGRTDERDGERSNLDINATGDIVGGSRYTYDRYTIVLSQTSSSEEFTANGSFTRTNYNPDGTSYLNTADYYEKFAFSSAGATQQNITISGKVGTLCLGGSVSFATDQIVREDQVNYLDENNVSGSNVLPYSGTVTLTGTSQATVIFDNNVTHTNAVVHIGDTNATYGGWSTLATGPCGGIM